MKVTLNIPARIVKDIEKVKGWVGHRSTTRALETLLQAGAFEFLDPKVCALEKAGRIATEDKRKTPVRARERAPNGPCN